MLWNSLVGSPTCLSGWRGFAFWLFGIRVLLGAHRVSSLRSPARSAENDWCYFGVVVLGTLSRYLEQYCGCRVSHCGRVHGPSHAFGMIVHGTVEPGLAPGQRRGGGGAFGGSARRANPKPDKPKTATEERKSDTLVTTMVTLLSAVYMCIETRDRHERRRNTVLVTALQQYVTTVSKL